jgi:hypothetical protein
MAEGLTISVQGVNEIAGWLDQLPQRFAKGALARALAAAAVPIVAEISARTPEGDESLRDENVAHLVDSIQTIIEVDSQGRGGRAEIGFGKMGYLALWLEYGWKLTGHQPHKKFIKNVPENGDTYLTGSRRYFMRDGMEAAAERAIEAFCNSFSASMDEYASKLIQPISKAA